MSMSKDEAWERMVAHREQELVKSERRIAELEAAAIPLALEYQQGQMSDHHSIHRVMWEALIKALGPDAELPQPTE